MRLALYHPQIPQNTGTLLRLGSCLGVPIDLIRPFGFLWDDKKLRRAGMDYLDTVEYKIHDSFTSFLETYANKRLIAMEANSAAYTHCEFAYEKDDILIVGSEHYGFLPQDLEQIPYTVKIPMRPNRRSINMALSAAIVLSESLRQAGEMSNE